MRIDLNKLRDTDQALFDRVAEETGKWAGTHDINLPQLKNMTTFNQLAAWHKAQHPNEYVETSRRLARPSESREWSSASQDTTAQLDAAKRKAAEREAAVVRLETYWEKEEGLINNQHNADTLTNMLLLLNEGFTVESVDNAITILRNRGNLQWKSDKPVAPATPVKPAAPAKLKDGTDPLPLDADEFAMRRASKEQLRDLSRRRGEGQQRQAGWSGSSFIDEDYVKI